MYRNQRTRVYFNTKNDYKNFQVESGAIDKNKINTVYFIVKGFLKFDSDNNLRDLGAFERRIQRSILKNNTSGIFNRKFISTPEYPNSFVNTGFSFMSFDYTLFVNKESPLGVYCREIDKLVDKINTEVFEVERDIQFYRKKLPNQKMRELM